MKPSPTITRLGRLLLGLLPALSGVVLAADAPPAPADHIFTGRHIITMEADYEARRRNRPTALAIRDDEIVWLGSRRKIADWTGPDLDMLALDDALHRLDKDSPEARQIVELKYFSGLTETEIASLLDVSDRTVRRRWIYARAWLLRELGEDGGAPDGR